MRIAVLPVGAGVLPVLSGQAVVAPAQDPRDDRDGARHGARVAGVGRPGSGGPRRHATVPRRRAAIGARYEAFLGCVSGTQEGAMGVHYVNGDWSATADRRRHPEALMYEMRNGRLHLLGVEYIVIAEAWDANNPLPPTLLGQVFTYNTSPNRFGLEPFYALHVWAWGRTRTARSWTGIQGVVRRVHAGPSDL